MFSLSYENHFFEIFAGLFALWAKLVDARKRLRVLKQFKIELGLDEFGFVLHRFEFISLVRCMFAVKGYVCIKLVDFTLRFFIALLIGQHFKMTKSARGFE